MVATHAWAVVPPRGVKEPTRRRKRSALPDPTGYMSRWNQTFNV
jgi:hypothetical protein